MSSRLKKADADANGVSNPAGDPYYGFDLQSVTWGYRHIFKNAIEQLYAEGYLGSRREKVTRSFFEMLKNADQSCFDHVLRQFLGALTPSARWIMDVPSLFCDLTEFGSELAENKLYYGMKFFETLARGGIGESPLEMRNCLTLARQFFKIDPELSIAFLDGYSNLSKRLNFEELQIYTENAVKIHEKNRKSGYAFMRGELNSSEHYIVNLTKECRLEDVREQMKILLLALTGNEFEIEDLSKLDSDDLIQCGTTVLSLEKHLYLPSRIRTFDTFRLNFNWYMLSCITAAGMISENAFSRIHGQPDYKSCVELAGRDIAHINLFVTIEYLRVLRGMMRRWPGAASLVKFGIEKTFFTHTLPDTAEQLLRDLLDNTLATPLLAKLRQIADSSLNCFTTRELVRDSLLQEVIEKYPGFALRTLQPNQFLSDFLFPVEFSKSPDNRIVADMKNAADNKNNDQENKGKARGAEHIGRSDSAPEQDEESDDSVPACYVYDEWDWTQQDYRQDWCYVRQTIADSSTMSEDQLPCREQAEKARAFFEKIRPALVRREKHLETGDDINVDMLVTHMVERKDRSEPPVRFYEKQLVNRRDLAVLILMDISGSTGERPANQDQQVIDVEKQAAVILGEGLSAIDDQFSVCGFCSNGREQCEYHVFKDFKDSWDMDAISRVMSAWPKSSTRIGPALRHAGWLLSGIAAKQRLIIVITDGKPMDRDYDPETRYAQYDVRMACEENARQDIHTFAISTDANSPADMDVMFTRRRFVLLPDINSLPKVLPRLYLRLTL